jgi:hypothetical protein
MGHVNETVNKCPEKCSEAESYGTIGVATAQDKHLMIQMPNIALCLSCLKFLGAPLLNGFSLARTQLPQWTRSGGALAVNARLV